MEEKVRGSDFVIWNDGTLAELEEKVCAVLEEINIRNSFKK